MSKTPEQYRDGLGRINKEATESRPVTKEEIFRDWPEEVDFANGSVAVAAQVLRDMRQTLFIAMRNNQIQGWWPQDITAWGAERGIDLSKEEPT
jgi:hypothetical protein